MARSRFFSRKFFPFIHTNHFAHVDHFHLNSCKVSLSARWSRCFVRFLWYQTLSSEIYTSKPLNQKNSIRSSTLLQLINIQVWQLLLLANEIHIFNKKKPHSFAGVYFCFDCCYSWIGCGCASILFDNIPLDSKRLFREVIAVLYGQHRQRLFGCCWVTTPWR